MTHILNDNKPLGGLDLDSDPRAVAPGDYINARNIRNAINRAGKKYSLTSVLSTVAINKYILPYSAGVFPAGINKCIGTKEDTQYNTVIAFIWNSNKQHQILRFYRNNTDSSNPYGEVQQIMCYDFGWTKKTRITGINFVYGNPKGDASGETNNIGDLLYWNDPKPRKINLTKANICTKYKSWKVILAQGYANSAFSFQIVVRNYGTNTPVSSIQVNIAANLGIDGIFASIANQINSGLGAYLSATACDCKLEITEKDVNKYVVVFTATAFKVIPQNWYGTVLIDRFFDHCKWPALNAPQVAYKQDTDFLPNYVKRKVFQFRLRYNYDDREQSVLGVWSQVPVNNLACDGNSDETLNYIDVDFNDPELLNPTTLVLLRSVDVIVRELNTGANKQVISLEPCEFIDRVNGTELAHYRFYNNIASLPIDVNTAAQLYDDVPLEVNDELFTKDRMVMAGIKTGYDAPECPKASYTIDFDNNPNPTLYKVKFRVRVLTFGLGDAEQGGNGRNFYSAFPNYQKYPFWISNDPGTVYALNRGGIFHDTTRTDNNFPFFGGGGFGTGAGGDFGIRGGMETDFDQRIPEGGWPIYAAGLPYFGVSRQISVNLPTDGVGALETSTQARRDAIGAYLYGTGPGTSGDLYSEVEILVPAGEYVFRVASHWCSFGDVLGKGFMYDLSGGISYQKTSTNVHGIFDSNGNWQKEKEIRLVVNADIPNGGTFLIMDLAPPFDFELSDTETPDIWQPLNLYLFDSQGNSDINSDAFAGVSVEKAGAFYQALQGWGEGCTTDHNGYFFGITVLNSVSFLSIRVRSGQNPFAPTLPLTILTDSPIIYYGSLTDLVTKNAIAYNWNSNSTPPPGNGYAIVIGGVATDTPDARNVCSTLIEGRIVDGNGNPINGALAVYENGRVGNSAQNGRYSIVAWADMVTANAGNFSSSGTFNPAPNRTVDDLIFQLNVFCLPTYPSGQSITINIDPFGPNPGQYNPTNPYLVADFIIDERNNPAQKARKRGGSYIDVIRYYDPAGRICSCAKLFELYVPFETEDLNKALPNQYTPGTYIQGKPTIKWALDPSFAPPIWAAYYQFMRSKDLSDGRYLQWIANQVTYLSAVATDTTPEIETSFENADAVAIRVSIDNIVSYAAANNDSQIGYTYVKGDRVRLMADRNLQFYQGIIDFEVTSYDETNLYLYLKPNGFDQKILSGTLIQVFNPKSVADDQVQEYWEVGEVYKCTAPGQANNAHSVTSGTFTNGDTYWRGRLIVVNDDETKFAAAYPVTVEDASISDFYPSLAQDIGRVGIIDPAFTQLYEPGTMIASADFQPGTAVNGLSTFNPNLQPEVILDRSYGDIVRVLFERNNLVAITRIKEISNYINRQTLYQAGSNNGVVSLSGDFFGTDYVHAQNLGTDLAASVLSNNGNIYGWNSALANVWKYQGDGEKVISDVKLVSWFKQLQEDGVNDACAVYDRYHEEYILTYWRKYMRTGLTGPPVPISGGYNVFILMPSPIPELYSDISIQAGNGKLYEGTVTAIEGNNITVQIITKDSLSYGIGTQVLVRYSLPETISWFEGNPEDQTQGNGQRWRTFYDFKPECYGSVGAEIVSFINGRIYIHDKGTSPRNTFYGKKYNSLITPVFNQEPDINKVWNAIWVNNRQDDKNFNWFSDNAVGRGVYNLDGQLSRLKAANFRDNGQGVWTTAFKRDLTDSVATNPIINGREMMGQALMIEFQNDYGGEILLWGFKANWTPAERTTK